MPIAQPVAVPSPNSTKMKPYQIPELQLGRVFPCPFRCNAADTIHLGEGSWRRKAFFITRNRNDLVNRPYTQHDDNIRQNETDNAHFKSLRYIRTYCNRNKKNSVGLKADIYSDSCNYRR